MFAPQDEMHFQSMLGGTSIPKKIEIEYEKWRKCSAACGQGAALGMPMCIMIFRSLGFEVKRDINPNMVVDWRNVEEGTEVVCFDGRPSCQRRP